MSDSSIPAASSTRPDKFWDGQHPWGAGRALSAPPWGTQTCGGGTSAQPGAIALPLPLPFGMEGEEGRPYRQEDLRGAAHHLDVLVVEQAAADRDDVVVLGSQVGVEHRCHQAARAVLHPPRAVQ